MTASRSAELPVIDYSKLIDPKNEASEERAKFYAALRDIGFVYLKHPGVNQATVDDDLFEHSKMFFTKPQEEKIKILGTMDKGRGPSHGYSCPAKLASDPKTSDIKEFFGMYRDDDTEKPNQWLHDEDSQIMRRDLVWFFDSCHAVILNLLTCRGTNWLATGHLPFLY